MGQRITMLTPFGGFSAETAGALTLLGTAHFGIPVSTTHTLPKPSLVLESPGASPPMRLGDTHRIVIVWAWLMTIPGAALLSTTLFRLLSPLLN
jgi:PiT family inorganic phosphate transporter